MTLMNAQHDMTSLRHLPKGKKRKERKDAICICIFSSSSFSSISNTTLTHISIMYCHVVVFVLFLCPTSIELLMKEITVLRLLRRYPGVLYSTIRFCIHFLFDTYIYRYMNIFCLRKSMVRVRLKTET
jgi:hypothetical protein